MPRKFNTTNRYNIIGFCYEMQEHIRIVRYVPENRLVCVVNLSSRMFWNHPEDINNERKLVPISGGQDEKEVFAEVSYAEVAAAGWEKYLRIYHTNYDFNDSHIEAVAEDNETITLTMWGGYIGGRYVFSDDIPRTARFFLHIHKPAEIRLEMRRGLPVPEPESDLSARLPEFFDEFTSGSIGKCLFVDSFHTGTKSLNFRLRNPVGEIAYLDFSGRYIELAIDRTDWRIQCIGEETFTELCKTEWYCTAYEPYSETWDHEHCILCNASIGEGDEVWMNEERQTASTKNVCGKCRRDFAEFFREKE